MKGDQTFIEILEDSPFHIRHVCGIFSLAGQTQENVEIVLPLLCQKSLRANSFSPGVCARSEAAFVWRSELSELVIRRQQEARERTPLLSARLQLQRGAEHRWRYAGALPLPVTARRGGLLCYLALVLRGFDFIREGVGGAALPLHLSRGLEPEEEGTGAGSASPDTTRWHRAPFILCYPQSHQSVREGLRAGAAPVRRNGHRSESRTWRLTYIRKATSRLHFKSPNLQSMPAMSEELWRLLQLTQDI